MGFTNWLIDVLYLRKDGKEVNRAKKRCDRAKKVQENTQDLTNYLDGKVTPPVEQGLHITHTPPVKMPANPTGIVRPYEKNEKGLEEKMDSDTQSEDSLQEHAKAHHNMVSTPEYQQAQKELRLYKALEGQIASDKVVMSKLAREIREKYEQAVSFYDTGDEINAEMAHEDMEYKISELNQVKNGYRDKKKKVSMMKDWIKKHSGLEAEISVLEDHVWGNIHFETPEEKAMNDIDSPYATAESSYDSNAEETGMDAWQYSKGFEGFKQQRDHLKAAQSGGESKKVVDRVSHLVSQMRNTYSDDKGYEDVGAD